MTDAEIRAILSDRLAAIEERIAAACKRAGRARADVTLVAVTKTVGPAVARLLPELGVADLGESRPQELWRKSEELRELPVRWHLVGHLQRNKIEPTVRMTHLTHSADSLRLLEAIDALKGIAEVPVLLEVNASREANKHGFTPDALPGLVAELKRLTTPRFLGLMTMAAAADDPEQARPTFAEVRRLRDELVQAGMTLPHLSMGMSNDFEGAIEEGATLIRLGTVLFEGLPAS
jgi:pyridoxal phosphate enzyme (YggS family)